MSALILGYNNRIDAAVLSGGNWSAGLPLANLQQRNLAKKARSLDASLASATFDIDLDSVQAVRVAALCNHNLSVNGRFRMRASRVAGAFDFENSFLYSDQFDNGAWTKVAASIAANVAQTFDGFLTAEKLVEDSSTAIHYVWQDTAAIGAGQSIVRAIKAKAGERSRLQLVISNGGDYAQATFNLSTGAVSGLGTGGTTPLTAASASMTSLGTGWWLLTIGATASSAGAHRMQIRLDNGTTSNYAGNGASGAYIASAQENRGNVLLPYSPTTVAANPAGAVFSSGWDDAWPAVYDPSDLRWEDDNFWSGRPSDAERAGQYANTISPLIDWVNARYWRVEVDDQRNPAGYIEMGRMFLGPGFQPAVNMSYGAALAVEPNTPIDTAMGGREFFDRRPGCRVSRFSVDWMTIDEGLRRAYELERQMGNDLEVFLILDPDDLKHAHRRNFLGRLRQLSALEFPYYNTTRKGFEVKELL